MAPLLAMLLLGSPAANDALDTWISCVRSSALAWAPLAEPAETIATGVLAKCSELESRSETMASADLGSLESGKEVTRRAREMLRGRIIQIVLTERAKKLTLPVPR